VTGPNPSFKASTSDATSGRPVTRLLVLGGNGMLGSTLVRELGRVSEIDLYATVRDLASLPTSVRGMLGRQLHELQVLDDVSRRHLLETVRPDVVVNAVGVVKQAPEVADHVATVRINSLLPHQLAQDCNEVGARLVHVSTDCVFSGRRGLYRESDLPDPVDFYGRSKLVGEVGAPHLTVRTSIIGPELTRNSSLLGWFLAQDGKVVRGFDRAIYSGVTTVEFARFLRDVVLKTPALSGLFQLASTPISKYDLLHLVAKAYGWTGEIVRDEDFSCDRSMTGDLLTAATAYTPPAWPEMIALMRQAQATWAADESDS
jgi:dTDP-4-dehydrorhamnose reductase